MYPPVAAWFHALCRPLEDLVVYVVGLDAEAELGRHVPPVVGVERGYAMEGVGRVLLPWLFGPW